MNPELIKLIGMLISISLQLTPKIIEVIRQIKDPDLLNQLKRENLVVDLDKAIKDYSDLKNVLDEKEKELLGGN